MQGHLLGKPLPRLPSSRCHRTFWKLQCARKGRTTQNILEAVHPDSYSHLKQENLVLRIVGNPEQAHSPKLPSGCS